MTMTTTTTTTTTMDVIEHESPSSRAAPHPGTAALPPSSASTFERFHPLLHATLPLRILHPSSSPPSTRRYSPRSPPFTRLFPIFLPPLVLSLFLRLLSPSYPKNRANPFRSFPCVFLLQPTLGAYGATHEIAFQLFYPLLPLTSESSPRGGFFASLCLLLRSYPSFLSPPSFSSSLSLPSPARCQLADPPSQCRRTRSWPKKKKERGEKPAQVRSSTLWCARRSMDLCSFRDSSDPNISAAAATAAPRVIYASTSIGVDEVERPSRIREGERKSERENKGSDRAQPRADFAFVSARLPITTTGRMHHLSSRYPRTIRTTSLRSGKCFSLNYRILAEAHVITLIREEALSKWRSLT